MPQEAGSVRQQTAWASDTLLGIDHLIPIWRDQNPEKLLNSIEIAF